MEIKDRMEQFRLANGLTVKAFEKACGIANGGWASVKDVSELNLIRFFKAFPDVDTNWLIKGEETIELENYRNDKLKMHELLNLCKSLVCNYQQRDEVMSQLVSMVKNMEG